MKLSLRWLKDYISIKDSPSRLAQMLTGCGLKVESVSENKELEDFILDIEVTPNRPDCLSIFGIAREVSALTGTPLKYPETKVKKDKTLPLEGIGRPLRPVDNDFPQEKGAGFSQSRVSQREHLAAERGVRIIIEDKKKCQRYTGRIIEGVKVKESPLWIKRRLEAVGLRPINNIVDITNFVLMELGHPLHAFDYDKLSGGEVIVRRAKDKESLILIGGIEKKMTVEDIVIADKKGPIALAGIMGGEATEVGDATRAIFLEGAHFDAASIRRTSRRLGLESESSYRFERGVALANIAAASERATELFQEVAGGKAKGEIVDKGIRKVKERKIFLNPDKVNATLGTDIKRKEVKRILKRLSFSVEDSQKEKMEVTVPHFRRDVTDSIDLIEEVARIFGYEKIGPTLPEATLYPHRLDPIGRLKDLIRDALTAQGMSEIITYSLISKNLESLFNDGEREAIQVKNPLSQDQAVMRSNLLSGGLRVVSHNLRRGINNLRLFELGRVYFKGDKALREELTLSLFLTGFRYNNWQGSKKLDFFDMKGIIVSLFRRLGMEGYTFKKRELRYLSQAQAASLKIGGKEVGILGRLEDTLADRYEVRETLYLAELSLESLAGFVNTERRFKEIPKYPGILRDMALVVKQDISSQEIVSVIRAIGERLISKVRLFDVYHGKQIPLGFKGLAYSVEYHAPDRTLTDEEIDSLHSSICDRLKRAVGAEIRDI